MIFRYCPCGSASFRIGLKKLYHSSKSRLNAWFLDDGTTGDEFSIILDDVLLEFFKVFGLSLNPAKCEVLIFNASSDEKTEMLAKLDNFCLG